MLRLLVIVLLILAAIFWLWRKNVSSGDINKSKIYKTLIFLLIFLAIVFFIATSGKFIFPQLLNITKLLLPFLTKFIGI